MIFVYGGMINLDATVQRTEELARLVTETSDYYPIFVSWESRLWDAYFDHLRFIRRGYKTYTFGHMSEAHTDIVLPETRFWEPDFRELVQEPDGAKTSSRQ